MRGQRGRHGRGRLFWRVYLNGLFLLLLVALAMGVVGWLYGGPDRGISMRVGAITGVVVGVFIFVDRVMAVWDIYSGSSRIAGRPIATIGAANTASASRLDGRRFRERPI